jgi:hypothetical protein
MDKHKRPAYRCLTDGCENLPGFIYSGGLLRNKREVLGKHSGPETTVNCPHPTANPTPARASPARSTSTSISVACTRTLIPPADMNSPDDKDCERSGMKRKRRSSTVPASSELTWLRDEFKREREENEKLRAKMKQQPQHWLTMAAQIV